MVKILSNVYVCNKNPIVFPHPVFKVENVDSESVSEFENLDEMPTSMQPHGLNKCANLIIHSFKKMLQLKIAEI